MSEFNYFGPGVSNYFKFVKWCFWVFVALSVLYIPNLIFAINGYGSMRNLSKTMVSIPHLSLFFIVSMCPLIGPCCLFA
jgi:hypothetical protein